MAGERKMAKNNLDRIGITTLSLLKIFSGTGTSRTLKIAKLNYFDWGTVWPKFVATGLVNTTKRHFSATFARKGHKTPDCQNCCQNHTQKEFGITRHRTHCFFLANTTRKIKITSPNETKHQVQ